MVVRLIHESATELHYTLRRGCVRVFEIDEDLANKQIMGTRLPIVNSSPLGSRVRGVWKLIPIKFKFAKEMKMIASKTFRISHRWTPALLVMMVLMMLSILPAWGADKTKDEETISNGTSVLTAMLSAKEVPADTVAKADCIVVIPNYKKGGLVVGVAGGRGPMSCRTGSNFEGKWSPPAMYTVSSISAGLQIGGTSSDFVILLMDKKAVDAFMQQKTKLGRDASVAAGPGASAASAGGDVLTYARTSGLFAGLSLSGATLEPDNKANERLYDKPYSAKDIIFAGTIQPTPAGQAFMALLDSKIATHGH
jgi:SH3 domain-containing YSC84-like protein 1